MQDTNKKPDLLVALSHSKSTKNIKDMRNLTT